jgi:predicted ribosome quality control (RQC) complex YloA/Tae2 family protein
MRATICLLFLVLCGLGAKAQVVANDTVKNATQDSIELAFEMNEIVISNVKDSISEEDRKNLILLKRRTLKVFPFAKTAADKLTMLNTNMEKLKTEKEKKKYAKIVENYLENEFEGRLKKLSRKEGQILVKLIYRQTGTSTFNLIKEHKSGWKAFWSNRVAHMFNIDLKKEYSPATVPEDYHIEGFLIQAFKEHRLADQAPAFAINYKAITLQWREKNKKSE